MPKEQVRKRGKRKSKREAGDEPCTQAAPAEVPHHAPPPDVSVAVEPQAGPSGLHPARAAMLAGLRPQRPEPDMPAPQAEEEQQLEWQRGASRMAPDPDAPFGILDPDLKGYFRTVEDQIRDWEGISSAGEEREDRQNFLTSVLTELRGHELQVATDPDTAVVLERLLPSLGDWGRRVIGDAFGDNWEALLRHRFGSHVAQTWFTLAADTLDREARGDFPPQQSAQDKAVDSEGILPTMTTLITTIITSLLPNLPHLLTNPHASPPIRLLLLVISPNKALPSLDGSGSDAIRSKRSNKYRKGQDVKGKSIFGEDGGKGKGKEVQRKVPKEVLAVRSEMRQALMQRISGVEWRSMGVDAVGSAAVQLLLELEIEAGESTTPDSILDHLTEGLVTDLDSPPQPYPTSLLTTQIGTRLFETILRVVPQDIFDRLWELYFVGKAGRLAGHPYANFVVAKGVSRLDKARVEAVVNECRALSGGKGLIQTARTSVLQALVERVTALNESGSQINELIVSALDLPSEAQSLLILCLMTLKTYPTYQSILTGAPVEDTLDLPEDVIDPDAEAQAAAAARLAGWQNRRRPKPQGGELAVNMQGCLLAQGLVGLPRGNEPILESLLAQPVSTLLAYASDPIASHLLDAVLTRPSVPPRYRRRLIAAFLGSYPALSMDRMGSRVGDTIWAVADGYMREKIAHSLVPHALALGASQYGRFFARKLNLHLLERRPDEWRATVASAGAGRKGHAAAVTQVDQGTTGPAKSAKAAKSATAAAAARAAAEATAETKEGRLGDVARHSKEGTVTETKATGARSTRDTRMTRLVGKDGEEEGSGLESAKRKNEDEIDHLFAGFTQPKKQKHKRRPV